MMSNLTPPGSVSGPVPTSGGGSGHGRRSISLVGVAAAAVMLIVVAVALAVTPDREQTMRAAVGSDGATISLRYHWVPGITGWTVVLAAGLAAGASLGWVVGRGNRGHERWTGWFVPKESPVGWGLGDPLWGGSSVRFSVSTTKCSQEVAPMTLDHCAVSDLLEAFRSADGVDLVRESVRMVM